MKSRDRIWKIIRGLGEFTVSEVTVLTEEKASTVGFYVSLLGKAGYIKKSGTRRFSPKGAPEKIWRLIRDTGPMAPQEKHCLYDANTGEMRSVD